MTERKMWQRIAEDIFESGDRVGLERGLTRNQIAEKLNALGIKTESNSLLGSHIYKAREYLFDTVSVLLTCICRDGKWIHYIPNTQDETQYAADRIQGLSDSRATATNTRISRLNRALPQFPVDIQIDRQMTHVRSALDFRATWTERIHYDEYLKSDHWIGTRLLKLSKHDLCENCNEMPPTVVHHLTYTTLGMENVETDLMAVCAPCHDKIHANKNRGDSGADPTPTPEPTAQSTPDPTPEPTPEPTAESTSALTEREDWEDFHPDLQAPRRFTRRWFIRRYMWTRQGQKIDIKTVIKGVGDDYAAFHGEGTRPTDGSTEREIYKAAQIGDFARVGHGVFMYTGTPERVERDPTNRIDLTYTVNGGRERVTCRALIEYCVLNAPSSPVMLNPLSDWVSNTYRDIKGRYPTNISKDITRLLKERRIRRVGRGAYAHPQGVSQ